MVIHFQVDVAGASMFRRQVKLNLSEGATVSDALSAYAEKYHAPGVLENRGTAVVVNGSRGSMQQVLNEKDRVRIFKPRIRG